MYRAAVLLAATAIIAGILGVGRFGGAEAGHLRLLALCAGSAAIAAALTGYARERQP